MALTQPAPTARSSRLRERAASISRLLAATAVAQGAVFAALLCAAAWFEPRDFALYGLSFGLANMANSANTFAVETRLAVVHADGVPALVRVGGTTTLGLSLLALPVVALLTVTSGADVSVSVLLAVAAAGLLAVQQVLTVLALRHAPPHALSR